MNTLSKTTYTVKVHLLQYFIENTIDSDQKYLLEVLSLKGANSGFFILQNTFSRPSFLWGPKGGHLFMKKYKVSFLKASMKTKVYTE